MTRTLFLLVFGAASLALAQQNNWSIDRTAGVAVMDEVSPLTFRVANAATSRDRILAFTIGIPTAPYDIDGATAPSGWRASAIDRRNRVVTFRAIDGCTSSTAGLRPGQSALFEVRVLGVSAATDQANQNLLSNRTDVLDPCNTNVSFRARTGNATWTLVGLAARVTLSARALDVGDQVTVTLTITNGSTGTQSGITPAAPTVTGTATFALVSGPAPASVSNLAQDGSATFSWVYRATGRGTARFSSSARNATVSSPVATSPDLNVGLFPAASVVTPETTIDNGLITLQVLPTNDDTASLTAVTPVAPTITATGTARATLVSGPTPTVVDALASRATTAFTTTWRINGDPGDRVTFVGRATATNAAGAGITTSPEGSDEVLIQELAVRPSPSSVLSAATNRRIAYTVSNGSDQAISSVVLITPDANLFRTPSAVSLPAGWTSAPSSSPRGLRFTAGSAAARIAPGASQVFTINYASIGTVTVATPTSHKVHVTFADNTTARTWCTVTVAVNRPVPDVIIPIAVATPGRAHFTWSNPAMHDGVLLLRSAGAPPNTAPTPGERYAAGTTLGNATVVYEDSFSFNGTFADTGLTNGTSYFYRLYNRDEYGLYSPANVPASSPNNYLLVVPPGTGPSDPLWCSTVGLPALQQPFVDLGKAVYQSTNGSFFTANTITTGAPINGNEKWRPSTTRGVVQARPLAVTPSGGTEPALFVGDQQGYAYRLASGSGAITWVANGGVALGQVIQASATFARRTSADAAFQAKYASDLTFFATRNNTAGNSVVGVRADTGAAAFTWQPAGLGQIVGAMFFDYGSNTLWVPTLGASSLYALNALDAAAAPLLTVSDLGAVPGGVTASGVLGQVLVASQSGTVRGYGMTTRAKDWEVATGMTVTAPLVSFESDFIVSGSAGVRRYHVDRTVTPNTVSLVWSWSAVAGAPTTARVLVTSGKVYFGDAGGWLRRLNLATGVQENAVRVSTVGGVSTPSVDITAGLQRVYVGTADGRLCVFPLVF
ncbi:MAG: hypothetical protein ACOZQL_11800 [Myxococcota bacterium]